jgi:xanthine dehydrogenase YagR molybdenum-binding subunit
MSAVIGSPLDRVEGKRKVTGDARYAADFPISHVAYCVPVVSTIASGRIKSIDSMPAKQSPGVLAIITRENCPRINRTSNDFGSWTKMGEARLPFEDDVVHYAGQYVALVVAITLEQAIAAASLVRVEYEERTPAVEIDDALEAIYVPKGMGFGAVNYERGDAAGAMEGAVYRIDANYSTPVEHHNPMEPSATTAVWNDGDLTLYDATQWVMGARNSVADMLGMDRERVRIVAEFVGGGFGCKGFTWPHQALAAIAARAVERPVKLVLSRQQMFSACGHRPETRQHVVLGADGEGRLLAIGHDTISETSTVDEHTEMCGVTTPYLYACPNIRVTHKVVPVNIATPTPMRAPGESPGLFAVESALDELSWRAGIDPVELRLRNYAATDPGKNLPFSSKHLRECYEQGRDRIGWSQRSPAVRSMREGHSLIGFGMATATYPGYRMPGAAIARLHDDGTASISSATQDIGGGTYTTMAQYASSILGIPIESVRATLGDSRLPPAPVSGGSMTTASVMPAVHAAAEAVLQKLARYAVGDKASPLFGKKADELVADAGRLGTKDKKISLSYAEILRSLKLGRVEAEGHVQAGDEQKHYSFHSFGAQFAQVRVDTDLGVVRVSRMVSVFDIGRLINAKTARSQALSGIAQGIGMALMEQTLYDRRNGKVVSDNLADYLVPVNADVEQIEPFFIDIPDPYINAVGARGVGEIAITGVAPAIANAVYHATGIRVRHLPITIEKLIEPGDR